MAAYLYVRTTEFENADRGHVTESPHSQMLQTEQESMERYCAEHALPLSGMVSDLDAPWNADFASREGGARLLARLTRGDAVVVFAMERLFSSCYDASAVLERFRAEGVALHVVELDGDVTDPCLQLDLISAARLFAGLEKRRSVERIKNVKRAQRGKGRYLGGSRPFGYMIHSNGRLIENPMEQKVLKKILLLREQGLSLRSIAEQVSTPVAPVSFKTVQRILQRNV